ncbi:MAG: hypothetical protein ACTSPQ_01925 [Candidatus Helarchaeota archaeon]
MKPEEDEKIRERILLLKHCFYFDSLGEEEAIKFMNERLEEKGFKKVNTFQEAAYLFTDSELTEILNGIAVVFPFKGQYYTFKNNHLYVEQDSSDKVLSEMDRAIRIYQEKVWVILKILTNYDKLDLETLKDYISHAITSKVDYTQILADLQNNYQLVVSEIDGDKIFWKIPSEIKEIIKIQINRMDEFQYLMDKLPLKEIQQTQPRISKSPTIETSDDKTFIDLSEVLELIREDKGTYIDVEETSHRSLVEKKVETKKKDKKTEKMEEKSITVEGWIKKILKNEIIFRTGDGQEVRFICNRPELIAFCIGNINKQLRFYFDVKAAELVCQKVEVAD